MGPQDFAQKGITYRTLLDSRLSADFNGDLTAMFEKLVVFYRDRMGRELQEIPTLIVSAQPEATEETWSYKPYSFSTFVFRAWGDINTSDSAELQRAIQHLLPLQMAIRFFDENLAHPEMAKYVAFYGGFVGQFALEGGKTLHADDGITRDYLGRYVTECRYVLANGANLEKQARRLALLPCGTMAHSIAAAFIDRGTKGRRDWVDFITSVLDRWRRRNSLVEEYAADLATYDPQGHTLALIEALARDDDTIEAAINRALLAIRREDIVPVPVGGQEQ